MSAPPVLSEDAPRAVAVTHTTGDRIYRALAKGAGVVTLALLVLIGVFLLVRAMPALRVAGIGFLTETAWNPDVVGDPRFGIASLLYWTVVIAVIAMVIAVPLSVLGALFITEYAPRRLRSTLTGLVDLLAAVPSIIYGVWGFAFLQERMQGLARWLGDWLGFIPFLHVERPIYASSAFIVGTVMALMILPIATSVTREVFSQTPPGEKEAALALGGSRWGMIRTVVLPFGRGGIIGGAMLGMGRALGETIMVAIIASATLEISPRILESGTNSIAAHIALRFGESTQLGLSALMAAGLVLFIVTLVVNTLANIIVARSRSGAGVEL
jgi:phosphate transport system permease protein